MSAALDRLTAALADRYRIDREIGAGGMATVYLAHDIRHDRKVAIKVLRPELAAVIGAERFLAEIKTTANLQHPHILPLFDSGVAIAPPMTDDRSSIVDHPSSSFLFYVMPFIDGESLRDRLSRDKQLPIRDAVRIATEVAGALDYAHRHGIVHRDIKPENILLHDGRALVADFGIALAASSAGSRMTETGMSLGTPTYMSPEQAMGERTLDARTDVYALGCVTYEMLVGDPPFLGSTAQAIVAKVMTEKPAPPSRLRDTVAEHVDDAVLTALEKLPADRFGTAAEFAAALAGGNATSTGTRSARATSRGVGPWRRVSAGLAAIAIAALVLAAWALATRRGVAGPLVFDAAMPDTAAISFAASTQTTTFGTGSTNLTLSPDGRFAVYPVTRGDSTVLWYRDLSDGTGHAIAGTAGAGAPRISPDGNRIVFVVAGKVMLVPTGGGEARRLVEDLAPTTLEWISPTRLMMIHNQGYQLSWLDIDGGAAKSATIPRCLFGRWLEDQKRILCSQSESGYALDPATGAQSPIRREAAGSDGGSLFGAAFRIIEGRYLVYLSPDGDLRAAPYDRATHQIGRSVTMVGAVRRDLVGAGQFDVTATGMLGYVAGSNSQVRRMMVLRAGGTPAPLPVEPAPFLRYDLSRDRRWLAAVVQATDRQELLIYDLRNGQSFKWLQGEQIRHALWNPEGTQIVTRVQQGEHWSILIGSPFSTKPADTLMAGDNIVTALDPIDFTIPGVVLANRSGSWATLSIDLSSRPARFDTLPVPAAFASVSPDGRRMAFMSGTLERVMTSPFPQDNTQTQIAFGGVEPLWLSATELIYRSGVTWYTVKTNPATGEVIGTPALFGRDVLFADTPGWSNRLSHDGGIIYVQGSDPDHASSIRLIPNWVEQMKRAVEAANP